MTVEAIHTDGAVSAIGPYSQGVRSGQFLFISGQIPLDPSTGKVVSGDIAPQTHRVLRSVGAILEAAGASFEDVVRAAMNEVYETYFSQTPPARSTVQVAALPKNVLLEIDAMAVLPK